MGCGTIRPHQVRLPEIGEGRIKQAVCTVTRDRRRPHPAGRVYTGTMPVMAIGVACDALVCCGVVVWHICGGHIGGAHGCI
jgi:hypothetical protein